MRIVVFGSQLLTASTISNMDLPKGTPPWVRNFLRELLEIDTDTIIGLCLEDRGRMKAPLLHTGDSINLMRTAAGGYRYVSALVSWDQILACGTETAAVGIIKNLVL